jgi:hypothetical protein
MSKQFLYTVRTEYPTPDGRVFVVPKNELLYTEGNPLYDALVIEARTGARLRDGGDPVWFIRLYNQFKLLPSDGVDFGEYAAKLHPQDVECTGGSNGREPTPPAVKASPDGPRPPNLLCRNSQSFPVAPLPWRLLDFLWKQPNMTAEIEDTMKAVWGEKDATNNAASKAIGKANDALLNAGFRISVSKKNGHFVIG